MALSINTNLFALNAQRNLRKSESPLATAMQRLSSTLRINSAKDDAAGLAIATRMTTQINGLSVAMRNANDGVSFSQTAEGAMDEMINSLQRIYELANQAASNNTTADRNSMNEEVRQLISELDRIVTQTKYNGEQFLNQAKSISVQVGVDINETISISTSSVAPTTMGISTYYSKITSASQVADAAYWRYSAATFASTASVDGQVLSGDAITLTHTSGALSVINRINQYTAQNGTSAFSYGNALVSSANIGQTGSGAVSAGYLTINGIQLGAFNVASTASGTVANLRAAIDAIEGQTGVKAYAVGTAEQSIALVNTSGNSISVVLNTGVSGASVITTNPFSTESVDAGANGFIVLNDTYSDNSVDVVSGSTAKSLGYSSSLGSISLDQYTVNSLTVTTVGNANVTILAAKSALDTITGEKAKLGAVQNRLASTISNLDNVRENITSARSRIMDADFAVETANLTKAMIMQQAGISVLSQANTLPQNVLALLGGR